MSLGTEAQPFIGSTPVTDGEFVLEIDLRDGRSVMPAPRLSETWRFDVAILGLGYVGLPTALAFHEAGRRVLGVDVGVDRLKAINERRVDLLDDDADRLGRALGDVAFQLTPDPSRLCEAATVIICVPTPIDEHLLPDLSILRAACATVVDKAVAGQTIILTSTTYVGCTTDFLTLPLAERGLVAGVDVHIAFSPERIDPGNDRHAHEDVPRVVGGVTPACRDAAAAALAEYARNLHLVTSTGAAEMTKLLENTFRAVNIALANEISDVARALDLDVMEVIDAAATKPYGFMPFYPGPGVGGHCIPCDPHYLLWQLRAKRVQTPVIENAMDQIAQRPLLVVDRLADVLGNVGLSLRGSRVTVVGVTYKPDVQDVRESPALEIIDQLVERGVHVSYVDPFVPSLVTRHGHRLVSVTSEVAMASDALLVHTRHRDVEHGWLAAHPAILDATYRMSHLPGSENL